MPESWRPTSLNRRKAIPERQNAGQPARDLDVLGSTGVRDHGTRAKGCPGTWEISAPQEQSTWNRRARQNERGGGDEKSEHRDKSVEAGNRIHGTPSSEERCQQVEPCGGPMEETPCSPTVSTKLERIATMAKAMSGIALTTLAHHIDIDWVGEARRSQRGRINWQQMQQLLKRLPLLRPRIVHQSIT